MREYIPVSAATDLIDRATADLGVWLAQGHSLGFGEDLEWWVNENLTAHLVHREDLIVEDEELIDGVDDYVNVIDLGNELKAWAEDYETEYEYVYTSDIVDIYMSNMNDVETELWDCFGGLGDFDTITEAMSAGVSLYVRSLSRACMTDAVDTLVDELEDWQP